MGGEEKGKGDLDCFASLFWAKRHSAGTFHVGELHHFCSARCNVISETSSLPLFREFIYPGNVSRAQRRPPSLIYPLALFPSTVRVCFLQLWLSSYRGGGTLLVEGAGSILNLLSPNHIFPVSPGTGDSPIANLISDLRRRFVRFVRALNRI